MEEMNNSDWMYYFFDDHNATQKIEAVKGILEMAKKNRKHEPTDYHTAVNLIYNGNGEYVINIPARDLSPLDVVETAARLDMSIGEFVGLVTVKLKNNDGESLYIIPIEDAPNDVGDYEPIEEDEHHG